MTEPAFNSSHNAARSGPLEGPLDGRPKEWATWPDGYRVLYALRCLLDAVERHHGHVPSLREEQALLLVRSVLHPLLVPERAIREKRYDEVANEILAAFAANLTGAQDAS